MNGMDVHTAQVMSPSLMRIKFISLKLLMHINALADVITYTHSYYLNPFHSQSKKTERTFLYFHGDL